MQHRFARNAIPHRAAITASVALGALLLGRGAFAGITHVPGDYATIQAAIDASFDGDEVLLGDGTYTGPGNEDLTTAGRAITVRSENGAEACIIDVAGGGSAFVIDTGETTLTRIEGITLTTSGAQGRGIVCTGSSPTIVDCIFTDLTTTSAGAAVLITDGNPVFEMCAFDACMSSDDGGAIYVDGGTVTVESCTFSDNAADSGGAIYAQGGDVVVHGGTFQGNTAELVFGFVEGGAICVRQGTLDIDGGVFEGNLAKGESGAGGAVRVVLGELSIDGTQFTANRCEGRPAGEAAEQSGGAVSTYASPATIANAQFERNVIDLGPGVFMAARAQGGAVSASAPESEPSTLTMTNCRFAENEVRPNTGDPAAYNGSGGAVHTIYSITLDARDCVFETNACVGIDNNSRLFGGAIHSGGPATIVRCDFLGNAVTGVGTNFAPYSDTPGGGAISVRQSSSATIVSCTLIGNIVSGAGAPHGGAIRALGAVDMVNCLLAGNSANGTGGAIFVGGGSPGVGPSTLTADCSTIVGGADPDGAIRADAGATVIARNTIIRSNQPNAIVGSGTVDATYCNVTGGAAAGVGNIDGDPLFVDAANGDYRLASGSPSIDTGDSAALPVDDVDLDDDGNVAEPLPLDLDDAARVVGAEVDMGAYETDDSCDADLDGDDGVGFGDLTMLLASWGKCVGCPEDLDGDGSVGFSDLTALLVAWGPCP